MKVIALISLFLRRHLILFSSFFYPLLTLADSNFMDSQLVNAGFYYARNTENTRSLFRVWVDVMLSVWEHNNDSKEQKTLYAAIDILQRIGRLRILYPHEYPLEYNPSMISLCLLPAVEFPKWEYLDDSKGQVVIAHPNVLHKGSKDQELKHAGYWRLTKLQECTAEDSKK
jgi:hypothetical protein